MKVLVTGGTGLVGTALVEYLRQQGHEVHRLCRRGTADCQGQPWWNPASGEVEAKALDGADAIVHLAGANIGDRLWTSARKRLIRDSRIESTRKLTEFVAARQQRPATFICASAVGYYGDRGNDPLDEWSDPGTGFLADLCREWEAACTPAADAGVRVVNTRFGIVMSPHGLPLSRLLLAFRMGMGGRQGDGRQWVSWIDIEDLVRVIEFLLVSSDISGPVNAVSPEPVTNAEMTQILAGILHRPAFMHVPGFALRLIFRDMADEALLSSSRVHPVRLQNSGFDFRYAGLTSSLEHLLR